MIDDASFLFFVDRALDGMVGIVTDLGDDLANRTPDIPGANSPYVLLTHCLGVMDYWAGALVAGRDVPRDRNAEFVAAGPVAPLVARAQAAKQQLRQDLATADPQGSLLGQPPASYQGPDIVLTQAGALQHVYEELAQHLGQMEVIRDAIEHEAGTSTLPAEGG
mgnify:CR=1 FL=1